MTTPKPEPASHCPNCGTAMRGSAWSDCRECARFLFEADRARIRELVHCLTESQAMLTHCDMTKFGLLEQRIAENAVALSKPEPGR